MSKDMNTLTYPYEMAIIVVEETLPVKTEMEHNITNLWRCNMLDEKDIQLLGKMFRSSENLVLEEMERTRELLEKKIDTIQNNLDELKQYSKIMKLENDNTSLLLQMISDLRKDVDDLKKRTA